VRVEHSAKLLQGLRHATRMTVVVIGCNHWAVSLTKGQRGFEESACTHACLALPQGAQYLHVLTACWEGLDYRLPGHLAIVQAHCYTPTHYMDTRTCTAISHRKATRTMRRRQVPHPPPQMLSAHLHVALQGLLTSLLAPLPASSTCSRAASLLLSRFYLR
jgi:hypothetical protein